VAGGSLLAKPLRIPLLAGGLIGGAGLAGLGLSASLPLAMLTIGVAVAGVLLLEIVTTTLVQRIVPDEQRGRAVGVIQTSSAILYSLGSLLMPVMASMLGTAPVLIASAVLLLIGALTALGLSTRGVQPAALPTGTAALLEHPIFGGLPVPRLEAVARQLMPVTRNARSGTSARVTCSARSACCEVSRARRRSLPYRTARCSPSTVRTSPSWWARDPGWAAGCSTCIGGPSAARDLKSGWCSP